MVKPVVTYVNEAYTLKESVECVCEKNRIDKNNKLKEHEKWIINNNQEVHELCNISRHSG